MAGRAATPRAAAGGSGQPRHEQRLWGGWGGRRMASVSSFSFLPFSRSSRVSVGSHCLSSKVRFQPSFSFARWNTQCEIASDRIPSSVEGRHSVRSRFKGLGLSITRVTILSFGCWKHSTSLC